MPGGPTFADHLVDIFLSDITKDIGRFVNCDQFLTFTLGKRIDGFIQLLPGIISFPPRFSQTDFGITSEGDPLVLAQMTALVSPEF